MQMSETGTKKKILKVVEQLPDDATIEVAIERLYFLAKVDDTQLHNSRLPALRDRGR